MKFAILITTKGKENLEKAISSVLGSKLPIYVVTPEKHYKDLEQKYKNIKIINDKKEGKASAINLAIKNIKEDVIIFTDGDVYIKKGSISYITKIFQNKKVGGVTGKVISLNSKDDILGYWSHFLVECANTLRKDLQKKNKYFEMTGYLMAARKNLIDEIPKEALSEDGYISQCVHSKGYNIVYEEKAVVYVKYPTNFKDWIIQKRRSAGGYTQNFIDKEKSNRSFGKETRNGFKNFFKYPKTIKERYYLILLFLSRIYLWMVIFRDIKIKKLPFAKIWKDVKSTK